MNPVHELVPPVRSRFAVHGLGAGASRFTVHGSARAVNNSSFSTPKMIALRAPSHAPTGTPLVEGRQRPNLKSEDSGLRHRFSEAKVSLWMCENGTGHKEARGPTRR